MFPASQTIAGFDPELAAALDHERTRQEEHIELIASENYASRRVLEAQGSVLTNKYAEGYPGQALLRRLRVRRHRRAARHRPRQEALRRRLRQRAAAFRLAGECRRLSRARQAGRHHPRHEPRSWRTPDPRREGEFLGQALQRGAVRPRSRDRRDRLRAGGTPGSGTSAEDGHRGILRLLACRRLAAVPRDRGLGRRLPAGGHGARCRARGHRSVSESRAARPRRHDHDAQDAARTARWPDPRARER